jgi:hypothetical protein
MKVQRLHIEQQMAKISVESTMASLKIEIPKREMIIQMPKVEMSLDMEKGTIDIDMSGFWHNAGFKTMLEMASENAAKAKSELEQSRREEAAEADYIGALPSSGNAIGQVSRRNLLKTDMPEMNTGRLPEKPVKIEGKPGKLNINWEKSDLVIRWGKYEPPIITVEPKPSVKIELAQEPKVETTVVELEIPPETGRMIDAMA